MRFIKKFFLSLQRNSNRTHHEKNHSYRFFFNNTDLKRLQ
jgi:hypothetical protein